MRLSNSVAIGGLLFFGTGCSILAKMIFSVRGENLHGEYSRFTKPWFQVLTMFGGMSLCALLDKKKKANFASKKISYTFPGEKTPLLLPSKSTFVATQAKKSTQSSIWLLQIPTLLDMMATACGTTGLLFTTASVFQMLRGAQLIFVALVSVLLLKRKLNWLNYSGIFLCCVGIILVGLANILAEGHPRNRAKTLFGIFIILVGQLLHGTQQIVEEHFVKQLQIPAVRVVAWEGVFGVLNCLLWAMPLVYIFPGTDHGHWEDSIDSFYMFTHSAPLFFIIFIDAAFMLFYNLCGMIVIKNLGAVDCVIIGTLRTVCVWIIDLVLYYLVTNKGFGEAWTSYSLLQLVGFSFLVMGTAVYNAEQICFELKSAKSRGGIGSVVADAATTFSQDSSQDIREAAEDLKIERPTKIKVYDDKIYSLNEAEEGDPDEEEPEDKLAYDDEEVPEFAHSFYGQPLGSVTYGSYLLSSLPTTASSSLFSKS